MFNYKEGCFWLSSSLAVVSINKELYYYSYRIFSNTIITTASPSNVCEEFALCRCVVRTLVATCWTAY
jgi:hypothetical protein